MAATASFTVAGLLALATHLQQGLDHFQHERWAQAETELSAVVEAPPAVGELQEWARLYRGQARERQGKKAEALDDARRLLQSPSARTPRKETAALFQAAGGDPKSLMPEEPPLKAVMNLASAVESDDANTLSAGLSPELAAALDHAMLMSPATGDNLPDRDDALITVFKGIENFQLTEMQADPLAGRAVVHCQGDTVSFDAVLVLSSDRWRLAGFENYAAANGGEGDEGAPEEESDASAPEGAPAPEPIAPEATPEQRAEIEACLNNLGAAEFRLRAEAARRLKELGPVARPFLKARLQDPDPEIASAARELLGRR